MIDMAIIVIICKDDELKMIGNELSEKYKNHKIIAWSSESEEIMDMNMLLGYIRSGKNHGEPVYVWNAGVSEHG